MASELVGDFAGLESLIGDLEGMRDLAPEIAREASTEIELTVRSQFVLGVDPYGAPWKSLAESTKRRRPWRDDPPLTDTGVMRASLTVDAFGGTIVASMADPAGYHNDGAPPHLPQRLIFPDGRGLPESWRESAVDAAQRVMSKRWDQRVTADEVTS